MTSPQGQSSKQDQTIILSAKQQAVFIVSKWYLFPYSPDQEDEQPDLPATSQYETVAELSRDERVREDESVLSDLDSDEQEQYIASEKEVSMYVCAHMRCVCVCVCVTVLIMLSVILSPQPQVAEKWELLKKTL